MSRSLIIAAAFAVLSVASPAFAADPDTGLQAGLDADRSALQTRMQEFRTRAQPIADDQSLSREEREERIQTLWAEYETDVDAFRASVDERRDEQRAAADQEAVIEIDTQQVASEGLAVAQQVLAELDIGKIVEEALASVDLDNLDVLVSDAIKDLDIDAIIEAAMAEADAEMASLDFDDETVIEITVADTH